MSQIEAEEADGEQQNKLFLACALGDVSLAHLSPKWVEPRHMYMAVDRPTPIPELVRWLVDTLPLSVMQNYRDPDTNLTPMEVLCQAILAQEEWQRYHKGKSTRVEMSWECVRLLAVKQLGCHPETPILHACVQLHLQDSCRMPFSLLQQALRKFSHQADIVDPSGLLPLHIALAAARRRHRTREHEGGSDEEDDQELFRLIEKVRKLYPSAAKVPDPKGRLPLDMAIALECHDPAYRLAQSHPASLGIRSRFPSSLVFCTLLGRASLNVSFSIVREVSNYLE